MRKLMLVLSVVAVIAMVVLELTYDDSIKPDAVYPMVNQHIVWEK